MKLSEAKKIVRACKAANKKAARFQYLYDCNPTEENKGNRDFWMGQLHSLLFLKENLFSEYK